MAAVNEGRGKNVSGDVAVESRTSSWIERLAPWAGLLFVIGGVILALTPAGDETGETAAEVSAYADSHEGWSAVVLLFALVSLLLLSTFVGGIYRLVRQLGASTEAVLSLIGGVVLMVLFYVALNIWAAPLVDVEGDKAAAAVTYLAIDDIGWMMLAGAGVGAGIMAIAASFAAMRASLVPTWAGWLGVVLGVAAFATVAFAGLFAWLAWIALASIVMLMTQRRKASTVGPGLEPSRAS
jgi:hypothetical protein